jgi:nucleoside-diphosphate-sugar epimerase
LVGLVDRFERMIVVTGGTGFIGRCLVASLVSDSMEVCVITRKNSQQPLLPKVVQVIQADITQDFELPEGTTTIYHCAGILYDKGEMAKVNISGTRNIVMKALEKGCRFVHLSSAGVVGEQKNNVIDETVECKPNTEYELSKYHAEQIVLEHVKKGLKAQILRPTIVFGSGKNPVEDSFFQLIVAIRSGLYRNINKGKGIYNIIHKDEVVRALRILGEKDLTSGGYYFLNSPISFGEFASIVKTHLTGKSDPIGNIPYFPLFCVAILFTGLSGLTGKRIPLNLQRLKTLTNRITFSSTLLSETTDYFPACDVREYIRRICDEYMQAIN